MIAGIRQSGQERKEKKARTEQLVQNETASTGQLEQGKQNRTDRRGLMEQDGQNITVRTVLLVQDGQGRKTGTGHLKSIARTGLPGHAPVRTSSTGLAGHDCWDRTVRAVFYMEYIQ
jgi:hypothetical protein